MLHQGSDDI
jgi:hypothetical protein